MKIKRRRLWRWRCVRLRLVKCYSLSIGTRKWEHAISICCFHHCADFVCGDSGSKHQTRSRTPRIHNEQLFIMQKENIYISNGGSFRMRDCLSEVKLSIRRWNFWLISKPKIGMVHVVRITVSKDIFTFHRTNK